MDTFEALLAAERSAAERFVRYRLPTKADAEDVLQEVYLTAFQKFPQLKSRDSFRPWLLRIARNKCSDWFRKNAAQQVIPLEEAPETQLTDNRYGAAGRYSTSISDTVEDTLEELGETDRQILLLFFWEDLPQAEIAARLGIPVGTVKSRLHTAKEHFKTRYPYRTAGPKGEDPMKRMPEYLPAYTIEASTEAPFAVKWEELTGWFLIPREGEKLSWAMYDSLSRKCLYTYDMQVTGKARVHGIDGVELTARETPYGSRRAAAERTFIAQLTDTHCRYLAALCSKDGVRELVTFLDEEAFLPNWGFGEDNCGNETDLAPKGDIRREGNVVTTADKEFLLDIVGRYKVTINDKSYDTVCVMDVETYNCGVVSEQFLDRSGRTVLWRRFNRDDWAFDRYGKRWSEMLPDNDRLTVNGVTYVQWYDCITDHIL